MSDASFEEDLDHYRRILRFAIAKGILGPTDLETIRNEGLRDFGGYFRTFKPSDPAEGLHYRRVLDRLARRVQENLHGRLEELGILLQDALNALIEEARNQREIRDTTSEAAILDDPDDVEVIRVESQQVNVMVCLNHGGNRIRILCRDSGRTVEIFRAIS